MSIVYPSTVLLISPIVFVFLITNDNVSNKYFESNDMLIRKYYTTLPKSTEKTIIIEGTIVIPDPAKLESKLPSYFRHQHLVRLSGRRGEGVLFLASGYLGPRQ